MNRLTTKLTRSKYSKEGVCNNNNIMMEGSGGKRIKMGGGREKKEKT